MAKLKNNKSEVHIMNEFNYTPEKKLSKICGDVYELNPSSLKLVRTCQAISGYDETKDVLKLAKDEYEFVQCALGDANCKKVLGDLESCDINKLGTLSEFLLGEYNIGEYNEPAD
jgi:hypothetical protein